MVKSPPCSSYGPQEHKLIVSAKGLKFCRKSTKKVKENKKKVKQESLKPALQKEKYNNKDNIEYLRQLLYNIPLIGRNNVTMTFISKAKLKNAYKTKENVNKNIKTAAIIGFVPKVTHNSVHKTRQNAINAAQKARNRMGLPKIKR